VITNDRGVSYDTLYMPPDVPSSKIDGGMQFIKAEGVSSVYVTANESDIQDGRKMTAALQAGHRLGLRVYLDAYIGGAFSGDEGRTAAQYLALHPESAEVSRLGVPANTPSVNDRNYRSYVERELTAFLTAYDFDGVLLDEPAVAPIGLEGQLAVGDYFPYDASSRAAFRAAHGHDMPDKEDAEVVAFRQASMRSFLGEMLDAIKHTRANITTILVVLAHESSGQDFPGTADWNGLAAIRSLDVMQTDPYWYPDRWDWLQSNVRSLLAATRAHHKRAGVWVQAFSTTGDYDLIWQSLAYLRVQVPWLAVWVSDHYPNADMTATWAAIARVYQHP
jgi:hypothetical protein